MNYVDFSTSPNGMKLEADGTLGFMQSNLQDAITALAKALGVDNAILTGVVGNTTTTEGWIIYGGEVYYFEAGTKQATFIIEQTVVSTANENGASVGRYYTRKAKWGSGAGAIAFSTLKRLSSLRELLNAANVGLAFGQGGYGVGDWVVLGGLALSGGGTTVQGGLALYDDRVVAIPPYTPGFTVSAANPVYFDGITLTWGTSDTGGNLKCDPYTPDRIERFQRNATYPVGGVLWFKSGLSFLTDKFSSGLGVGEWQNWAIADGTNGTLDLSSAITGLTAVQRIS